MEPGRIVLFDQFYDASHYIATKYDGRYLFLSTTTLNRRDEFKLTIDSYEDTGVNIKDFNIPDLIDFHIEEMDYEVRDIQRYSPGQILKNKITSKYCSVSITKNHKGEFEFYLIDFDTFELTKLSELLNEPDHEKQFDYIKENFYTYDFYFSSLRIHCK